MRSLLKQAVLNASRKARAKRGELFRRLLPVLPEDTVLDLGGGDGSHIAAILPEHRNIWVADIDPRALEKAAQRGFHTILLPESGRLPFNDQEFDIVFCSRFPKAISTPISTGASSASSRSSTRKPSPMRFAAWASGTLFRLRINTSS